MCDDDIVQKNVHLDQILAERRSHRIFRPDPCSDDEILRILHAGLLGPFAAAAAGNSGDYFRRFFVLRLGSESMRKAHAIALRQLGAMVQGLEAKMKQDPALRAQADVFARRIAAFRDRGIVPGIGTAPFFIVVAERRGFPPVIPQSLAHCLENMWLKATALGLGFQLVSLTAELSSDPDFCVLLGIRPGEWELMGCAVGYPPDEISPVIRPPVEDVTRWLP